MLNYIRLFRIFLWSVLATVLLLTAKYFLHKFGWEPILQTSLHNAMISSVVFVIGFLLSATIADYKESERIPAEFASTVQDIYDDAKAIHSAYPKFDLKLLHQNLIDILENFRTGTRKKRGKARREISDLHETFAQMEKAGVPPNFVVKLKQQESQLLRSLFRVNYIQRIKVIPSAIFLARSIVVIAVGVLLLTDIDPFYGGLAIMGVISFVLIYMILLIRTISVPFHDQGATQDDVSLFLLRETLQYLRDHAPGK